MLSESSVRTLVRPQTELEIQCVVLGLPDLGTVLPLQTRRITYTLPLLLASHFLFSLALPASTKAGQSDDFL
jgi:hypothetical protein